MHFILSESSKVDRDSQLEKSLARVTDAALLLASNAMKTQIEN
jgi:hypothetical protein